MYFNASLDLITPSGKSLTGMLAVFAGFEGRILRERVIAGITKPRGEGKLIVKRQNPAP